jgi:selenocysteine lyase/cysteine desulfurase
MNAQSSQPKTHGSKTSIYLNTAASGLLSQESIDAAASFQEATLSNSIGALKHWMSENLPRLRTKTADLLGASEGETGFVPNFSYGLLPVVHTLEPHLNNVLLYKDDYASLNMPFELADFNIHYVKSSDEFHISTDEIKSMIDQKDIEIVAISHVQYLTGFKIDIDELGEYCRKNGVVFIVDGTQSIGAADCSFSQMPADVLISSSYKWLNGGFGSAVLCIEKEFINRFPPCIAGYGSLDDYGDYTPSVKSFEPGHLNAAGLLQLEKAVDQKLEQGLADIETHNMALLQKIIDDFAEVPFTIRGSSRVDERLTMVCFEADEDVFNDLTEYGFSLTWRKGMIRISPHFYNSEEDIDALINALKEYK